MLEFGFHLDPAKVLKVAGLLQRLSVPLLVFAAVFIGAAFFFGLARLRKSIGFPLGASLLGLGLLLQIIAVTGWWLPLLIGQ